MPKPEHGLGSLLSWKIPAGPVGLDMNGVFQQLGCEVEITKSDQITKMPKYWIIEAYDKIACCELRGIGKEIFDAYSDLLSKCKTRDGYTV